MRLLYTVDYFYFLLLIFDLVSNFHFNPISFTILLLDYYWRRRVEGMQSTGDNEISVRYIDDIGIYVSCYQIKHVVLRSLAQFSDANVLLTAYYGFLFSHLTYGIAIWAAESARMTEFYRKKL